MPFDAVDLAAHTIPERHQCDHSRHHGHYCWTIYARLDGRLLSKGMISKEWFCVHDASGCVTGNKPASLVVRISSKAYEEEGDLATRGHYNEEQNMRVKTRKHRVVVSQHGELDWVDTWRKRTKNKEKGRANSTNMVSKAPEN